ncbi:MAG TPA: hypothetical protein VF712_15730 [Thermoleophilaceae bacterium]
MSGRPGGRGPGRIALLFVLAFVATGLLALLLEEAGDDAALAAAVAAIAVLVGSWVRVWVLAVRSGTDEDARSRLRDRIRPHVPIIIAAPLVIVAAHPWGTVSYAVALGIGILCQFLFLHSLLVANFVWRWRARRRAR